MRVLIACRQMQVEFPTYEAEFERLGIEAVLPAVRQQLTEDELLAIIGDCDGVIAGDDHFTRAVLAEGRRLQIVSKWGVGVDNIDRVAAAELGIAVTNTPGTFDDEVADVCVGYLIMLTRGLHVIHEGVRNGEWTKIEGRSLANATLGIVGLGGIGLALARRALAMRMIVLGHDVDPGARRRAADSGVRVVSFEDLVAGADAISLNCPLTPENRHLMDDDAFSLARPGIVLVNTARGPLVDERALARALDSGVVAAAALDVFEHEPLAPDHPLRNYSQLIFGSHNASNTRDAVARVSAMAVDNLLKGLGLR